MTEMNYKTIQNLLIGIYLYKPVDTMYSHLHTLNKSIEVYHNLLGFPGTYQALTEPTRARQGPQWSMSDYGILLGSADFHPSFLAVHEEKSSVSPFVMLISRP